MRAAVLFIRKGIRLGIADDRWHRHLIEHIADILDIVVDGKRDTVLEEADIGTEVP